MAVTPDNNFIQKYERALQVLSQNPDDRNAQHEAVLALARMGSLSFAITEYKRYDLDKVRHHEDIMALGGRLSKDLYLVSSGKKALGHARDSAHKYEAAFQDTQGYYSGVNAATMALMAEMPEGMVLTRTEQILDLLPARERLSPTEHYFIEATRSECLLLMGDTIKARECLKNAIAFDPLNYTAHASTLKQFHLIISKRNAEISWLDHFQPPRPVHFAGHMWAEVGSADNPQFLETFVKIRNSVSDRIQVHDVGFGYGALAAGSDILIAEVLLEEGADLHVILPCDIDQFIEKSVRPYGRTWVERFHTCIQHAQSVLMLPSGNIWPNAELNRLNGKVAMGAAIIKAAQFGVSPSQLLIWNQDKESGFTSHHAFDWCETNWPQIVIPLAHRNPQDSDAILSRSFSIKMTCSDGSDIQTFGDIRDSLKAAEELVERKADILIWLDIDISGSSAFGHGAFFQTRPIPTGIYLSEILACLLVYSPDHNNRATYAGIISDEKKQKIRSYRYMI